MRATCRFAVLLMLLAYALEPAGSNGQEIVLKKGSGQRYAILVGIDDYNELEDLKYCGADQVALKDALLKAGFPEDQVFLLHDSAKESKYRPHKINIEKQLDLVLNLVERDDVLVFGFSGHGAHLDGKSYLLPAEANVDDPATRISRERIYQKLQDCRASLKVAMIDACRDDPRPAGRRSATPKEDRELFAKSLEKVPEGLLLFTSCAPGEISMEDKEFGHGVFMNFVLEGMAGKADADSNRVVTLKELFTYAGQKTKLHVARRFNGYQTPRKNSAEADAEVDDFAFVKLDASRPNISPPNIPLLTSGKTFTNSIGMNLIEIPAGKFTMGSPKSEVGRNSDETEVEVTLTKSFYLGQTEVTQSQWKTVMKTEPWKAKLDSKEGASYPATYVSWDDAQEFCRKLSSREGKQYRLPTEAEWEYACRGGTKTRYSFGDDDRSLSEHGWWGDGKTHEVGLKKPNRLGLSDMHGNVWEWCSDWYADELAGDTNPTGPVTGSFRVRRGGASSIYPAYCRSAFRYAHSPDSRESSLGFRLACSSER